jgi:hypothetical protein
LFFEAPGPRLELIIPEVEPVTSELRNRIEEKLSAAAQKEMRN